MNGATGQFLIFGIFIVVIVALMFRNGRKRQRDAQALKAGLQPGAQIMTTFGVYGTVESIDDAANKIVIETSPGHHLTIHRQAVGSVVQGVDDAALLNGSPVVLDDAASAPEFGERVDGPVDAPRTGDAPSDRRSE